jgi:TatD DNase family protein
VPQEQAWAQQCHRLGQDVACYFSINSEMLKNERHRATVAAIPLDRLLTETDGPFVHIDGRPVRPSDVEATVARLAHVRSMEPADIAAAIRDNLKRLLSE